MMLTTKDRFIISLPKQAFWLVAAIAGMLLSVGGVVWIAQLLD